jgi:hypothetical protein
MKDRKQPADEAVQFYPGKIQQYKGGHAFLVLMTVDIANWVISLCEENFRKVPIKTLAKYVRDMAADVWTPNFSDNIVIFRKADGSLSCRNGQTRAHAIAKTGKPQYVMLCITDCEPNDQNYDSGQVRMAVDVVRKVTGWKGSTRDVALSRKLMIQQGVPRGGMTHMMIANAYIQYQQAIDFVLAGVRHNDWRVLTTPILAAMVRGYYEGNLARVREFRDQLISGKHPGGDPDDGARLLKNLLSNRKVSKNEEFETQCEKALAMFLTGQPAGNYETHSLPRLSHPGALLQKLPPYKGVGAVSGGGVQWDPETHIGKVFSIFEKHPRIFLAAPAILEEYKNTFDDPIRDNTIFWYCKRLLKHDPRFVRAQSQPGQGASKLRVKFVP